jgi:hypothetical protein
LATLAEMSHAGSGPINECSDSILVNWLAVCLQFLCDPAPIPVELCYVQPVSQGIDGSPRPV